MLPEASDFRPGQGGRLTATGPWRNGAEVTECQALWLSISGERPTAAQKGGLHTAEKEPCLGQRGQPVRGQGRSVLCALGGDLAWAHVGPAKA